MKQITTVFIMLLIVFCFLNIAGCLNPSGPSDEDIDNISDSSFSFPVPRKTVDGKSVFALPELRKAAVDIIRQLKGMKQGEIPRVAFSFFTMRNRKSSLGESIAQDLATMLVQEGGDTINVYTRRKLYEAAREMKRQQSDLFDTKTMVQLGKFSGVHFILMGHIEETPAKEIRCNCQILDIETAQITGGFRFSIPIQPVPTNIYPLDDSVGELTRRLLKFRVDKNRELRVGVFGVTRNKKDFKRGTDILKEISTEMQLAGDKNIKVFTRHDIDKAVAELKLQMSDMFDESQQAKIGNFVGANCVLTGYGELYKKSYKFNLIFVDVETSKILSGAILSVKRI